jgi:hypothetical protein
VKRYSYLIIFLGLLIAGGFITTLSQSGGIGNFLPFLRTSGDAAASTDVILPWQAEQLFLLIGFLLINIIGIGGTLAGIFWFLNRGVTEAKAAKESEESA